MDESKFSFNSVLALFDTLTADNCCPAVTKFSKIWILSEEHEVKLYAKFKLNWLGVSKFLTTMACTE